MSINVVEHNIVNIKEDISKNHKSVERYWINSRYQFDITSDKRSKNRVSKLHPMPFFGEVFTIESNDGEFKNLHLGLIFQNDNGNKYGDTTIILPITDYNCEEKFDNNIHFILKNDYFESVVNNGLDKDSVKIKLSDITTISKARLREKVGKLKPEIINRIKSKMKNILYLK